MIKGFECGHGGAWASLLTCDKVLLVQVSAERKWFVYLVACPFDFLERRVSAVITQVTGLKEIELALLSWSWVADSWEANLTMF